MHQRRYSPAACGKDHDGTAIPCSLWRQPCQSTCLCPEGSHRLWKVYAQAGSPDRNCGLGRTHNRAVILKDCSLWKESMLKQVKRVRSKEKQRGAVTDWPQPPILHPLCAAQWRKAEVEEVVMKQRSWAWEKGWGERCLNLSFFLTIQMYFNCQ